MALSRSICWALATSICMALMGCATNRYGAMDALTPEVDRWIGRFSLTRTGERISTNRLTLAFELSGSAEEGELILDGPLGARLARATWAVNQPALLQRGHQVEPFDNISALTEAVVGQPLPMHALFQWLRGSDVNAPPWSTDLTQWSNGKLTAWQTTGTETVRIVVVFDGPQPTKQTPAN